LGVCANTRFCLAGRLARAQVATFVADSEFPKTARTAPSLPPTLPCDAGQLAAVLWRNCTGIQTLDL